jgi:hypothetical protein
VNRTTPLVLVAGVVLLAGLFASPWSVAGERPGDDWVRGTIRLGLGFYAAAAGLMLFLRPAEWDGSGRGQLARWCWSLAWAIYVIHVGMAFHFYHGWSHADAVRHTEEVSGFGPGIYVSHLFTLWWTLDIAWWWLWPQGYASRPAWIGRSLHAFMAFVAFNGTVVYEKGPIRWAGLALFATLGGLWVLTRARRTASGALRTGETPVPQTHG